MEGNRRVWELFIYPMNLYLFRMEIGMMKLLLQLITTLHDFSPPLSKKEK